jgi:hypothetical protein
MDQMTSQFPSRRKIGVSCTAAAVYAPKWVKEHAGKKVVIHRDYKQVQDSLMAIGLPPIDPHQLSRALYDIEGFHIGFEQLFERSYCRDMWEWLFPAGIEFDEERHGLLSSWNVQPNFDTLHWSPEIGKRLMAEARGER